VKAIPLINGKDFAIIDDDDFNFLSRFRWYSQSNGYKSEYAWTIDLGGIFMHDLLMWPDPPLIVRHLDDIGLHNFRSNLKVATQAENLRAAVRQPSPSGLPRGVIYNRKNRDGYIARIWRNGRVKHIGTYCTPEAASAAYEEKRKELFGDEQ
jgi:hypothetical protein